MERTKAPKYDYTTQLALEAFKSTGYLIVNKTLIKKFGLVNASILSNYIDKYQYFHSKEEGFDGSFFLKHKDIMEQLNVKEPTVVSAKKKFIEVGILTTEMKGAPAKEWITINFQSLTSSVLDPLKSGGLDPLQTGGLYKENKLKENKDINITLSGIEKRNKSFQPLAEFLYKIIRTSKNIKYSTKNINTWAVEIRKLSEINDIPFIRIKKALRWYKNNIGGKYIPVIESGYALRMKFLNLEAARNREENNSVVDEEQLEEEEAAWMREFGGR